MSKKTRREIKEMFKAGAQPTGQDFSDFIDSITNSIDDGFTKPSDTSLPLRVETNGENQNVFDFYDDDGIFCWRINQYPEDTAVGGVSVKRAGLNIEDSNSESRLFIKQNNGDVGIGIVNPTAKLHVVHAGTDGDSLRVDDMDEDTTPFLVNGSGALKIRVNPDNYDESLSLDVRGPVRFVNTDGSRPSFEIHKGTDISPYDGEPDLTVDTDGDTVADKPEAAFSVRENGAIGIGTDAPEEGILIKGSLTLGDSDDDVISIQGILKSTNSSETLTLQDSSLAISSDSGPSELKISGSGAQDINAGVLLEANQGNPSNYRGLGMFMFDSPGQNEWFIGRPYSDSDSLTICRKDSITEHDVSCCYPANAFISLSNSGCLGIGKAPASDAKLDVAGNIKADGKLTIGGSFVLDGGLHVGGSSEPGDKNLIVDGNADITGSLTVSGDFTVNGQVYAKDIEHVTGNVVLGDEDSDIVTIEGILKSGHSSGELNIDAPLNVTGDIHGDISFEWIKGPADISAQTGTWNIESESASWGQPSICEIGRAYNESAGVNTAVSDSIEFDIPDGAKTAYVSHAKFSNCGYVEVWLKTGDVWRYHRCINTYQNISADASDGNTIDLAAVGCQNFSKIKFQVKYGRFHFTGLGFTRSSAVGANALSESAAHYGETLFLGGNIGIGTDDPQAPLSIRGNGKKQTPDQDLHITSECILFGGNNANKEVNSAKISAGGLHGENTLCIVGMSSDTSYATRKVTVWAEGGMLLHGKLTQTSDERLKKNIKTLDNALSKINQLRGVSFEWKEEGRDGTQIGIIAQELEKIFPELVTTADDGYKSVCYDRIGCILIEAFKELEKKNEELAAKNRELEERIAAIERELA